MRARTAWRWSGAAWALPLLFAVTCLVGVGDGVRTGYASDDLAGSGLALYLAGPLLAAMTALRFRAVPRSLRLLRTGRRGTTVLGAALWPLVLGGPACISAGVMVAARSVPDDRPSTILVAVYLSTALACALTGAVLSWALPVAVSVPTAAGAWFAWLAYVPANGGVLLQNLDPTFAACCSARMQPATGALAGALALTATVAAGCLGLVWSRTWAHRSRATVVVSAAAVLVVGLGAGTAALATDGREPTLQSVEPRATHLSCRTESGVPICLWPEQGVRAADVVATAGELNQVAEAWGLPPITVISARSVRSPEVAVNADRRLTRDEIRYSLASGYVDRLAGCPGSYGRWSADRVAAVLLASGSSESDVGRWLDAAAAERARTVLQEFRLSPAAARARFEGDRTSIRCGWRR